MLRLAYETDGGAPRDAALGLVILQVDETIEADFRLLLPQPGLRLYHSRIPSAPEVTTATLPAMAATLTGAAALLPAHAGLGAIGYACTSASTVLGEAAVARLIAAAHPDVPSTNPLTALKAACRSLGIARLGLVSPYEPAVSQALRDALVAAGIAVTAFGTFDQKEERLVARISTASVLEAVLAIGGRDCDAVFAACTNLRAVEVLAEAERRLGKPVLASNQVMAWHMLRLAGSEAALATGGALSTCRLAAVAA